MRIYALKIDDITINYYESLVMANDALNKCRKVNYSGHYSVAKLNVSLNDGEITIY